MSLVLWINTLASLSGSWSLSCQKQGQPQKPEDKNKETKNRERRQFTNMANILSQLISFSSPSETWRITFSNIRRLLLANIVKNKGLQMTDKQQAYRWVVCVILWCRRSLGCWDGKRSSQVCRRWHSSVNWESVSPTLYKPDKNELSPICLQK